MLPEANIKHATGGLLLPLEMPSSKQAVPHVLFQKITGLLQVWQRNLQEMWDLLEWPVRDISNGANTYIWETESKFKALFL